MFLFLIIWIYLNCVQQTLFKTKYFNTFFATVVWTRSLTTRVRNAMCYYKQGVIQGRTGSLFHNEPSWLYPYHSLSHIWRRSSNSGTSTPWRRSEFETHNLVSPNLHWIKPRFHVISCGIRDNNKFFYWPFKLWQGYLFEFWLLIWLYMFVIPPIVSWLLKTIAYVYKNMYTFLRYIFVFCERFSWLCRHHTGSLMFPYVLKDTNVFSRK